MSAEATVLYDAPGPKGRQRNLVIAVVFIGLVLLLAGYVLFTLYQNGQLDGDKWSPFLKSSTWTTYILPGLWGTIVAAAFSILLAMILGAVLGIGRLSDHAWVRTTAGTIVEVFRAIPVLVLIFFFYVFFSQYGLVPSEQLSFAAVVAGLALYNGSVMAEILRSGINSLPRGQIEASQALGLRKGQMMNLILLPQAVTAMLPALVAQMVVALKDSALGYVVSYVEVVRSGMQSATYYSNYLPALIVVAIIMIAVNVALSSLATRLEQRLRQGRRKADKGEDDAVEVEPTAGGPK